MKPGKYFELECQDDGTVLKEIQLKRKPAKPIYDEVWENDDGKDSMDSCTRMKRHYRHAFLKPKK